MNAAEMVEAIRAILDQPYADAYALQEIRRVLAPPVEPKPAEERSPGVVELPDKGPVRWIDTGSGPGYFPKDDD